MWTAQTAAAVLAFAAAASAQCGSAAVDELVGFAAGTTGGGSGSGVTVTSCSEFTDAVEAGGVITIAGTITDCDTVRLASDTTLIGVGADSGFQRTTIRVRQVDNVIIRNLNFYEAPEGGDLIDIDESTNIWVDHNAFSNPATDDKDFYDGMLDAKHAADFLTVSWNVFHDHWKGTLVGHSASNEGEDSGHLQVTYHHNVFSNVNSRLPSIRFGTGHIYSSCYSNTDTSGINIREGANAYIEANSFTGVHLAITTDLDADIQGLATEVNNIFTDSDINITQESSWRPSYDYTVDPADCVCELLASQAGPGVIA